MHMERTRAVRLLDLQEYPLPALDERQFAEDVLAKVVEEAEMFLRAAEKLEAPAPFQEPLRHSLPEPISERELEVLALIAQGLSNQEIAERLFIGVSTVKKHINHLYGKLGVVSRTQALVRARELHLL